MKITVVYAEPLRQTVRNVELPPGACVQDAIDQCGILALYPQLPCEQIGIFGKQATLNTPLSDGDRVEIYRPLPIDPKKARQARGSAP